MTDGFASFPVSCVVDACVAKAVSIIHMLPRVSARSRWEPFALAESPGLMLLGRGVSFNFITPPPLPFFGKE